MTRNPANQQPREPLDTLRSVRGIQPGRQAAQRAVQRALAAVQGEFEKPKRASWRGIVMRSSLAAAVLIVVVTTGWLVMSGPDAVAAPTWADVVRQTSGIDTVHIDARMYEGSKLARRQEIWIKSPGVIRSREYEWVDGKAVPTECSIASPTAAVRWDERTQLGEHASTGNRYLIQSSAAGMIEAVLGLSLLADRPDAGITINGELAAFVSVEQKHSEDATLRGFRLENKSAAAPTLPLPFDSLIYWFAAKSNTLCRLSLAMGEGAEAQRSDMLVDFSPKVPADWFDVKLPVDCVDVAEGVAPRLPPEVREVYDKVVAARKRFGDYRAVIWRNATGGWPMFREAARGEQWRCDEIDWVVMHGAVTDDNRQGYVTIGPEDPFGKLWAQVTRHDYELTKSAMTFQGKYAILHYKLSGRGPRVSAQLYDAIKDGYEKAFAPSLRSTAWPEWIWWENLHPHGWNLRTPPFKWRLGPSDPEHPGWIEVIGERAQGLCTLVKYTLDRERDWLCVRQEWAAQDGYQMAWDITEFGQTAGGLWYPRRAKIGNGTYDYAVQRGAAEPGFFKYPPGMPQPADPFAQFEARADQAAAPAANVPPTTKGKYTAIAPRGLPRGFDDKAKSEANSEMVRKMDHISRRLDEFAYDRKWVYPETLQEMVDEEYLEPDDLRNPLHPQADPPFGYIRPNRKLPNRDERMVLYEPFSEWPGVVAVLFGDHSVEYIHDKAQFEKLLKEATAPEPPSRPGE